MGLCQSAEAEHGGGKKHRRRKGKRAHDGEEPSTRKHESSSRNNRKNGNKKSIDRKSDPNGSGKHHQSKPAAVNPGGSGGAHPPKSSHDVIGKNHDTSLNSHGSPLLPPVIGFHPAADDTPLDEPQRQLTRPHSILKRSASNNNFSDDFTTPSALAEAAEEAADQDAKSAKGSRSKQLRRSTLTPGESGDASTAGDFSSRETSNNMPHSPYTEQHLHSSQNTAHPPQRTTGGPNGMGVSVCTAAPEKDDRGTPEHHRYVDGPREDPPAEIAGNPLSVPPALPPIASAAEYDASRSGIGALVAPMGPNSATRRTPGRVTFEVTEEEPGHAAEGADVLPAAAVPTHQIMNPVTTLEIPGATSTPVPAARPPPPAPPTPPAIVSLKPSSASSAASTAVAAPPNAVIVTIRGQKYNLEPLLGKHPGGSAVLRQFNNRDATDQFLSSHSPPPFAALRKYEFPRQEL